MKTLIKILCLSVLWFSCESPTEPLTVHGCLDSQACNYNPNATIDNNSCEYVIDCFGECGGDAIVDECGICDGNGVDADEDRICDDIDECIGEYDACGICNGPGTDCGGSCNDENIFIFNNCYNIETTTEIVNPGGQHSYLPSEIGKLINLTRLEIQYQSSMIGEIPSSIGNLNNLEYLIFNHNQLSGEIPIEVYNLTNLKQIYLSDTNISGTISSAIGNLTNLTSLELSNNQLTGEIPSSIGNLTNLINFSIGGNQLTGEIPPEIGNLINIESFLNLNNNQLTGEIPLEILNLNIYNLYLNTNQLSGIIPEQLCDQVYQIYIGNNQLCPPYPSCISGSDIDSQDTSNCP